MSGGAIAAATLVVCVLLRVGTACAEGASHHKSTPTQAQATATPTADTDLSEPDFPYRERVVVQLFEAPRDVTFVFEPDVPAESRRTFENATAMILRYFQVAQGVSFDPFTLIVGSDIDWLSEQEISAEGRPRAELDQRKARWAEGWRGFAGRGTVAIRYEESWAGDLAPAESSEVVETLAHELTHLLQEQIGVPARPGGLHRRADVPTWLIEGHAELQAAAVLDALGLGSFDQTREYIAATVRSSGPSLYDEYPQDRYAPYTLGLLAVDFALGERPVTVAWDYWREVRGGATHEQAFRNAFGRTVAQFEAEFAAYREANFPRFESEVEGRIQGLDVDASASYVYVCSQDTSECYNAELTPKGTFRLFVPPGEYTVVMSIRAPHEEDAYQYGYYVEGGPLAKEPSQATVVKVPAGRTEFTIIGGP